WQVLKCRAGLHAAKAGGWWRKQGYSLRRRGRCSKAARRRRHTQNQAKPGHQRAQGRRARARRGNARDWRRRKRSRPAPKRGPLSNDEKDRARPVQDIREEKRDGKRRDADAAQPDEGVRRVL